MKINKEKMFNTDPERDNFWNAALSLVAIMLLLLAVGSLQFEDEQKARENECKTVDSRSISSYNENIKDQCEGGKPNGNKT